MKDDSSIDTSGQAPEPSNIEPEASHPPPLEEVPADPDNHEDAMGPLARALAVVTDPVAAMKSVKLQGGWLVPLGFMAISVLVFFFLAGDLAMDMGIEKMEQQFEQLVDSGRLSQEQADEMIAQRSGGSSMKIFMLIGSLLSPFIAALIIALVSLLVGNLILGGDQKFGRYWSLAWHAYVIGLIGAIVTAVVASMKGDLASVQLGLGIFTQANPDTTLHKVMAGFSIFPIWQAVVNGIGVAEFSGKKLGQGIGWMVALYLIWSIGTSLIAGQPMI